MLLGGLRRWGLAPEVVDRLLPHADRALAWITEFGDRDGDGYVEYQRSTDRGAGIVCGGRTDLFVARRLSKTKRPDIACVTTKSTTNTGRCHEAIRGF